jgi:hypothetical protein
MAESRLYSQKEIENEVATRLETLQGSSDEELQSLVGELALATQTEPGRQAVGMEMFPLPKLPLSQIGKQFINANAHVREVVCTNKDLLEGGITSGNVAALVVLLGLGAVPGLAAALVVLIAKMGINEYCAGQK